MMPKFIKFRGHIVNLTRLVDVQYNKERTHLDYGEDGSSYYDGNHIEELWDLIKLAMQPKDAQPDITQLEERMKSIEKKIGENLTINNHQQTSRHFVGYLKDGTPVYRT